MLKSPFKQKCIVDARTVLTALSSYATNIASNPGSTFVKATAEKEIHRALESADGGISAVATMTVVRGDLTYIT